MRSLIFVAGAALALSACGGRDESEANEANAMMADNMMAGENMMMDQNMMMNGDGNMAIDPDTQNLMQQDLNTNAPDTNLANGL